LLNENIKKIKNLFLNFYGNHYDGYLILLWQFFNDLILWLQVEMELLEQVSEIHIKFLIKLKLKAKNLCEKLLPNLLLKHQ
jgi:hypothetical protein